MTTESVSFWTHLEGEVRHPHVWRYLGRKAQAYQCLVCELRVTKAELKGATDA